VLVPYWYSVPQLLNLVSCFPRIRTKVDYCKLPLVQIFRLILRQLYFTLAVQSS